MNADQVVTLSANLRRIALQLDESHAWAQSGPVALGALALSEYAADLKLVEAQHAAAREADAEYNADRPRARSASKPRPAAAGPRHKFGDAGTCVAVHGTDGKVCGKTKGRPGRPAAEPTRAASEGLPGVVPPDYRAPLGDAAADKFEGGGLGSSGVRR
jgi:hypothetical protein